MATIFTESFETDGNGTRYTTSIPEFSDGSSDFFTRTDGSNISSSYEVTDANGSFYFAAQDINGEGADSQQTLTFSGIDVSDLTNLGFNALFAEDDSSDGNEDWDEPDFVTVEYQLDGGGFNNLLAFENDGSEFNSAPLEDTDFDGTGEGTEVTDAFTNFESAIAQTGSSLDLRFTFDLDSGDEDIAVDAITVTGDAGDGEDGEDGDGGMTSNIVINEVDADTPGTDSAEFVELFDGGAGNTSLNGLVAVFYNGNGDSSYAAFDLDGFSTDSNGFFVLGNEGVANVDLTFSNNGLQNGADAVAIYQGDASDFPNGTAVTTDNLVDAIVYDTNDEDDSELLSGLEQDTQFNEGENGDKDNQSNSRVLDGTGSFVAQVPTPGAANESEPPDNSEVTPIYQIQGAALTSPLEGESVTTTGIVTAVDSNGFYLQDPDGDGNIATSDALFVFTSDAPGVSVGDELQVSGTVSEFFPGGEGTRNLSTTQISGSPTIEVVSSGNNLPDTVIIGEGGRVPPTENIDKNPNNYNASVDGRDFFESLEAMRVTAQNPVAIAGTNRFGEIFTVVDNGDNASGLSTRGTLNISPDDFNPEKVQIDPDSDVSGFDAPTVDTGAQLEDVTGVVSYGFGNFEIIPTEDFTTSNSDLSPKTTTIEESADELTVATYNVLNLDPNDNESDPEERDTDVADGRFDAIANDIVNNLNTPDIIGLQEVQDNDGADNTDVTAADVTLQTLVDSITAAGGPTYEFIDNTFIVDDQSGGQPGGNIRTAFLYDPSGVDLVDGSVRPVGDQDPGSPFNGARLPLAADFEFNGQEITIVNNHFSSKGGSSPIVGVDQPFEELQENPDVNGSLDERREQAQAVNDFVDGVFASDADANVVVVGDLNEFEFISPLDILAGTVESTNGGRDTLAGGAAVLTNLINDIPEDERYSFIFQGNSQQLDHILVSDSLLEGAEIDNVHVNSEFAETAQRASDHDPVLASLVLESIDPPEPEVNQINGTRGDDDLRGTNGNDAISGGNGNDTLNGGQGNDTIEGNRGGDIIRGGAGDDILAADRTDRFQDFDGEKSKLRGDNGNDTIFGGRKDDLIGGGNGEDLLFGKRGNDLLRGGGGDDTLNGGLGNDTLRGQGGIDTADYSDLTFNGVFGTVAGLDLNLSDNTALHSSNNNSLTWSDTITTIENVTGTSRNDRFIGNGENNIFDGQGEVGRSDRQTEFTALNGETYTVIADVVEYSGSQSDFSFSGSADSFTATGSGEGTDTLVDIEFVRFNADSSVVATSELDFA